MSGSAPLHEGLLATEGGLVQRTALTCQEGLRGKNPRRATFRQRGASQKVLGPGPEIDDRTLVGTLNRIYFKPLREPNEPPDQIFDRREILWGNA